MTRFDPGTASILVVDDTPVNLEILVRTFKARGHRVRPVLDGKLALEAARAEPPSLVLLDIHMPGMNGYEVCAEFKKDPRLADVPIIFISANSETTEKAQAFAAGGLDYVTKPFQISEVIARVETHLKVRRLQAELHRYDDRLQDMVRAQVKATSECQLATIVAMARLSEVRDPDTGNHFARVQRYCRALAARLAGEGVFGAAIDDTFVDDLVHASALHDIGKAGIPDAILLKPGKLTVEEFELMTSHTVLGAETLARILEVYPGNAFLRMSIDVARSHHERWDGTGYPDRLAGDSIPLAARILSVADQYDALRSKRPHKPPFDAAKAYAILTEGDGRSDPKHLDPRVVAAFRSVSGELDAIFEELGPDSGRSPVATME